MRFDFQASPNGMTTLRPRTFIVYVRPGYAGRFWAPDDGRSEFSGASLQEFAEELRRRGAVRLYGLPQEGAPGRQNLRVDEVAWLAENYLGHAPAKQPD
jgi:hypothetical protein